MRDASAQWLKTAERDLKTARALMPEDMFEHVAFHCQQAAEKAIKALWVEQGELPRTHSGLEMLSGLKTRGLAVPGELFVEVRRLDRCFIDSRYPNGVGAGPDELYDQAAAEELLVCCRSVMEFVKSNLS
ncbi:MAG: HEPN domain-containing protein [Armatimonadetes bacterium]|nr:HEPN domain-containing protein [Armatimonadota bacterium]